MTSCIIWWFINLDFLDSPDFMLNKMLIDPDLDHTLKIWISQLILVKGWWGIMTSKIVNHNDMICVINTAKICQNCKTLLFATAGSTQLLHSAHMTRTGSGEKSPAKVQKVPAAIFNGASFRVQQFWSELAELVESRDVQNIWVITPSKHLKVTSRV